MPIHGLPGWAARVLDQERVARLAFLDGDDRPRVLPITFAVGEGSVWSAVDDKPKRRQEPARVAWLRRRPEAALLVDVYDDDWSRLAWVQLLGRVEVLAVTGGEPGLAALEAKYPPYRERRPPGPLLCLTVERALSWRAED